MDASEMREAAAAKVAHYLDSLAISLDPDTRSAIITVAASTAISTEPAYEDPDEMLAREMDHTLLLMEWGIAPAIDAYAYTHGRAAYYIALGALLEMAVQS